MMYANKLAVAVKANGKVLREFGDNVYVPFGTEYTILIKNLNSVRAQVTVNIDGTEATEGCSLVIGPNQELELQRFIKNGNLSEGNRFKFIERTSKIENGPRGAKLEDGLIRIEYQFERPVVRSGILRGFDYDQYGSPYTLTNALNTVDLYSRSETMAYASNATSDIPRSRSLHRRITDGNSSMAMAAPTASANAFTMQAAAPVPQNDVGITVAGSKSTQQFHIASHFEVEDLTNVMVIHLHGETDAGKVVSTPVTVKAKPRCTTCGHQNKATSKFCSECGTSLEIM